ncbi:anti-repressor SinI family protein [Priestia aryabhattai]|uniref:anti-repressor SinI family protein n=1 Tax=Priestia megaterium TaxID=1404 RepID=UPI0039B8DBB5
MTMVARLPKWIKGMSMLNKGNLSEKELDKDWVELMKKAYETGLTVQQVREFLKNNK